MDPYETQILRRRAHTPESRFTGVKIQGDAVPRLPEAVNRVRRAVAEHLDDAGLTLVGCSGGADSLALAAAAAFHQGRAGADGGTFRVGAVVVDHQLHPDSAEVTTTAAAQLRGLGLDPVLTLTAEVAPDSPEGPEAAARTGRYRAFRQVLAETGAAQILLAHTRDDQSEQVLLGLARGSGTRSLAGIPAVRGPFRRPLLEITRAETEEVCAHAGLSPWQDPANMDPRHLRSRVRHRVLPYLEQELSGSIRDALARTARIAADDAAHLESLARDAFARLLEGPDDAGSDTGLVRGTQGLTGGSLRLDLDRLAAEPPAIRRRVIALAVVAAGGAAPSQERIMALERLCSRRGSAGPVQLEGRVTAWRGTQDSVDYGKLVIVPPERTAPSPDA